VRFGLEAFPEDAADVAQQWASETLVAKNGLVFCTEDMGCPWDRGIAGNGLGSLRPCLQRSLREVQ